MPGPASLLDISRACLVRYRDCLEDVGFAPLDLLTDVLAACSPEQLAQIEDGTLEGSGRDLAPLTWPLWLSHLTFKFGAPQPRAPLPELPDTGEQPADPPEPGARPAHYRQLYEQRLLELERRREVSGKRLRQLWEQEASERQAKQIQVIDPLARKRPRTAAASPSSSSRGSGYHPGSGFGSQPAGSRDRLLKKLGMGGGKATASSSGPGLRAAVPASRAVGAPPRIRPVQKPGLVAGRQGSSGAKGGGGTSPLAGMPQASIGKPAAGAPLQPRQKAAFMDAGRLPGVQRHIQPVPPSPKPAGIGLQARDSHLRASVHAPDGVQPQHQQQHHHHQQQQHAALQKVRPAKGGAASSQQAALSNEEILLDEPAWLLPAAPATEQLQQARSAGPGRSAGVQLLDEPAWLPRAALVAAAPQRNKQLLQKWAIPTSPASPPAHAALLLDEPAWLPAAAPKSRQQEATNQAPSHEQHKQQRFKGHPSSSKGSPSGKVPTAVASKAVGKPKLELPSPPLARTLAGAKKAHLYGHA